MLIKLSMAHFSFYRSWSSFCYYLKDDFFENKRWYILVLALIGLGFLIGLIAGIRISPDASISKLPDSALQNYLEGNSGVFGVFCSRLFSILLIFPIILVTNIKPIGSVLTFMLILYKSFGLGTMCAFFIAIFNLGGFVNVIFLLLPTQLLFLSAIGLFAIACVSYNFRCRTYGGSILCKDFFLSSRVMIITALIIALSSVILEILLLPWLCALLI